MIDNLSIYDVGSWKPLEFQRKSCFLIVILFHRFQSKMTKQTIDSRLSRLKTESSVFQCSLSILQAEAQQAERSS